MGCERTRRFGVVVIADVWRSSQAGAGVADSTTKVVRQRRIASVTVRVDTEVGVPSSLHVDAAASSKAPSMVAIRPAGSSSSVTEPFGSRARNSGGVTPDVRLRESVVTKGPPDPASQAGPPRHAPTGSAGHGATGSDDPTSPRKVIVRRP